jgi:hypothetical protein
MIEEVVVEAEEKIFAKRLTKLLLSLLQVLVETTRL